MPGFSCAPALLCGRYPRSPLPAPSRLTGPGAWVGASERAQSGVGRQACAERVVRHWRVVYQRVLGPLR